MLDQNQLADCLEIDEFISLKAFQGYQKLAYQIQSLH